MRIEKQCNIRRHVLDFPALANAAKFKPFAIKVLTSQGQTVASSTVDKARAVVGWFAKNAVHPQEYLHPNGTTLNTEVLPAGETWASFNALFNQTSINDRDQAYWYGIFPNGPAMLQALIGTTADNGAITDNGLLTEYASNKWRIRSFAAYRAPQCTLQCKMAQVVLAALGIQSIDISTVGHDPMAFYDDISKRWLYIDPTFGEMQRYDGQYLSPLELVKISLRGEASFISGERLPGAEYLASTYFTTPRLPNGMSYMTIHSASHWAGGLKDRKPYAFRGLPSASPVFDTIGTREKLLPEIGCGISKVDPNGGIVGISLITNLPSFAKFQRSLNDGVTWTDCADIDYLDIGQGRVTYRAVDTLGFYGTYSAVTV